MRGFATWAVRLAESIDLEDTEHAYKRLTARTLREARDLATRQDPSWPAVFKQAMGRAANLLSWQFKDDVVKAVQGDPGGWADVFEPVWSSGDPATLDALQAAVRSKLGRATPGNATGLGALLLMAANTEDNAPYNPTRTARWYQITGSPGPEHESSATDRYLALQRFLDEVRHEIESLTGATVSRLEAQGMAWTVTEHDIPKEWDPRTRQSLETFRGQAPEPPRAWLLRPQPADAGRWIEQGYVSLAATYLGSVQPGSDKKAVRAAVDANYQQLSDAERGPATDEFHAFLTRMHPMTSSVSERKANSTSDASSGMPATTKP